MPMDCAANLDAHKLVRDGTSQDQRLLPALDPGFAPVDGDDPARALLFARAFSAFLMFHRPDGVVDGDWTTFFSRDLSVRLAQAAAADVAAAQAAVRENLAFLADPAHAADGDGLKARLGQLFAIAATLALQMDRLGAGLPDGVPLKETLAAMARTQLAPALRQMLLFHRDGLAPPGPPPGPYHADVAAPLPLLGAAFSLRQLREQGLSPDWIADPAANTWAAYVDRIDNPAVNPPTGAYGAGATLFGRIEHIATHNLFTSVFERFLRAYARLAADAGAALQASFTSRADHEPHYALFLAFVRLFEHLRADLNTLTAHHLDFYYREVLRLKEKPALPGRAHLPAELARQARPTLVAQGALFRAGKDQRGVEAMYAASRDVVLNQAKVAALKTLYRHDGEPIAGGASVRGRLYASPVANSADGLGAPLPDPGSSWHPFHNKRYAQGALAAIDMPQAGIGFALASHYLLLEQGTRVIVVQFELSGPGAAASADLAGELECFLSSGDKWLAVAPWLALIAEGSLWLVLVLDGEVPAVTPYKAAVHRYGFTTDLPVLLVRLRHQPESDYAYARLQDLQLRACTLTVWVDGLKSLAVSNDFGPVDTGTPFQPYGPSPVKNSALVVGSREAFQKQLSSAALSLTWQNDPAPFKKEPKVALDYLQGGQWQPSGVADIPVAQQAIGLGTGVNATVADQPDLSPQAQYDSGARHGFVRQRLDSDFGQAKYQEDLVKYLRKEGDPPGPVPLGPVAASLTMQYEASQRIVLDSADAEAFARRTARFFHVGPFGQAERHALLAADRQVWLLPQFDCASAGSGVQSAGELYVGIAGLQPPQTLSLLVQVAPGTADPRVKKPVPHIHWSYLRANEWAPFGTHDVDDGTAGLLNSGIVTLAVPRDASADNTLLPGGLHWIRLSVSRQVDSACRLLLVAAQGMEAGFTDRGNDPAFAAQPLPPGSISRLSVPDPAIKQVSQPFPGFGGRAAEAPQQFRVRASERLRHKDRAIALWDAEHLVLEAFPAIYRARCLNHTRYEPGDAGSAIYRELAPGHVTVVTVPRLDGQAQRDPLRPYTGLDVLQQVEDFLRPRYSCHVRLHVCNPEFEEVRLALRLRLAAGADEAFYVNLLRQEITRFLSPWAFPGGAPPSFGGAIRKSVLVNFIEERPYVDYVTDVRMYHDVGGQQGSADLDQVEGSKAVSILVAAQPARHAIDVIHAGAPLGPGEHCPCEVA